MHSIPSIRDLRANLLRTFRTGGRFDKGWNSVYVGAPLWIFGTIFCLRWSLFHIPPPGYAIGALAVVAGLMSVREMKVLAKIAWVILLISFLFAEFRAIDKDHAENERQQSEFFKRQQEDFAQVTKQAATNFAGTTEGLTAAINGLQDVLRETKNVAIGVSANLENVTGGKSYAFLFPDAASVLGKLPPGRGFSVHVCNAGKSILTVEVAIAHVTQEATATSGMTTDLGLSRPVPAGALAGGTCSLLPNYFINPLNDDPTGHPHYFVVLRAQNGDVEENLYFRPGAVASWAYKFDLFKHGKLIKRQDWTEQLQAK